MNPEDISKSHINKQIKEKALNWVWNGEESFVELVKQNQSKGMVVVEIGCYDGSTTRRYIDIVKQNNGHVIVIDTFEGTTPSKNTIKNDPTYNSNKHWKGFHNYLLYESFLEKFKNYEDMMTVHKGLSYEKIQLLPDHCDIIFIDADHLYEAVKEDIRLSWPKVKVGGILSGHDLESFEFVNTYTDDDLQCDYLNNHHPGVSQAVFEAFGKTNLIGLVWFVKKI